MAGIEVQKMANEKRLIDANELEAHFQETKMIEIFPYWKELSYKTQCELVRFGKTLKKMMQNAPTVDAVEVPCHCCDCYYLLNGKNSFGLYFFCGHQNGLKNLRNTEKDFCLYAERRYGDGNA